MHYLYVGLLSPQLQEEVVNTPRWAGHLSLSFSLSLTLSLTLSPSISQPLAYPLCPLCFLGNEK